MSSEQKTGQSFIRAFHKCKDDPDQWADTALLLRRAAQLLFAAEQESGPGPDGEPLRPEDAGIDNPAAMLYGYAIENAIKGYLIKRRHGYENAQKVAKDAWNHHLCELAEQMGFPLTEDQKLLLRTLQNFVIWAGRYPIPRKPEHFRTPIPLNCEDVHLLDQLFDPLLKDLQSDFRKHLLDDPPVKT